MNKTLVLLCLSLTAFDASATTVTIGNSNSLKFTSPFFNEFVISCPKPAAEVLAALQNKKIIGGLALERFFPAMKNEVLVCVTETTTKEQIDSLVAELKAI